MLGSLLVSRSASAWVSRVLRQRRSCKIQQTVQSLAQPRRQKPVEAAKHLEASGLTSTQLSSVHHFSLKGRDVTYPEAYRCFGAPESCGAEMLTMQIDWCSLRASTRPRQARSRNSSIQLRVSGHSPERGKHSVSWDAPRGAIGPTPVPPC